MACSSHVLQHLAGITAAAKQWDGRFEEQSATIASLRAELVAVQARIATLVAADQVWSGLQRDRPSTTPATTPATSPATSPRASILEAVPTMLAAMEKTPMIALTSGGGAVAKKRGAPTGPRAIPAPEKRCMARTGEGDGTCQCKHHRKTGDFCGRHAKQVMENPDPLQFTEDGKRTGLFYGRIDQERPQMNANGEVCELWGAKMDTFPANTKWHSGTVMFKTALKRVEKAADKVTKTVSTEGVVTKKSPYHNFLAQNSAVIKEGLLRTSDSSKLARGEFSRQAGKIWMGLSAEQKSAFADQ
jgi:hypothetical protein